MSPLLTLIAACLWIIGVHAITRPGMLLDVVVHHFRHDPPEVYTTWNDVYMGFRWLVMKPITECPTCMASLHGAAWWVLSGHTWWMAPVFCVVLAGAVEVVTNLIWRNT